MKRAENPRESKDPDRDGSVTETADQGAESGGATNGSVPRFEDRQLLGRLGAILRERRVDRNVTIEQLAARAGVSAGLISQIERGIGNPSFGTLVRLSYALDLQISALFDGPRFDEQQMLVRRDHRQRLVAGDGSVHDILVPNANHKLGLIRSTFPPGFESLEPAVSHPGEEIVLVVSGALRANIAGQRFDLDTGDSLIFDSTLPHGWANPGDEPSEVLFVSTPPASNASG